MTIIVKFVFDTIVDLLQRQNDVGVGDGVTPLVYTRRRCRIKGMMDNVKKGVVIDGWEFWEHLAVTPYFLHNNKRAR